MPRTAQWWSRWPLATVPGRDCVTPPSGLFGTSSGPPIVCREGRSIGHSGWARERAARRQARASRPHGPWVALVVRANSSTCRNACPRTATSRNRPSGRKARLCDACDRSGLCDSTAAHQPNIKRPRGPGAPAQRATAALPRILTRAPVRGMGRLAWSTPYSSSRRCPKGAIGRHCGPHNGAHARQRAR